MFFIKRWKVYLKKIIIITFTHNPYKLKKFEECFDRASGEPIDRPEVLNFILKNETGHFFSYRNEKNNKIDIRSIGNRPRYHVDGVFKEPDRYIFSVENGTIWGQNGLIYNAKARTFIDESAKDWTVNLRESRYTNVIKLPPKIKLSGLTLSMLTIGADGGFYHFMMESLVKLKLYGKLVYAADRLIFNGPETGWKVKWLKELSIPLNKIIWMNNQSHYECEQLLFTNRLINDSQVNPWSINALNKLFSITARSQVNGSKIYWISRAEEQIRDIKWENDIVQLFPNISIVKLQNLGVAETITLMSNATHIIAPHGAGLTNLWLCNEGAKVLELYPLKHTFQPCYQRICALKKLIHQAYYLNFETVDDGDYGIRSLQRILLEFLV